MTMRTFVTGAGGYIGARIVRSLLAQGHQVWCHDRSYPDGQPHDAAGIFVGELEDYGQLSSILRSADINCVIHAAALAFVPDSVIDPEAYYRCNVAGSLALFAAMRTACINQIVFSSSAAVYGQCNSALIDEGTTRVACSPYGRSKVWIEDMLEDYCRAYGWGVISLRYFNVAGGLDRSPRILPILLETAAGIRPQAALHGLDFPTPDGSCVRDFVHVDDVASANAAALVRICDGQMLRYNIGSGCATSLRELVDACLRVTKRPIPTVATLRRLGDPPRLVADIQAAQNRLGWLPVRSSLNEIVRSAWEALQRQPKFAQ